MQDRLEKPRRRPAPAMLLRDVIVGRAFVVAGVELVDRLDAGLRGGIAKRFQERPAHALTLDAALASRAMRGAVAEKMVLVALEERQHVVVAPAGESE